MMDMYLSDEYAADWKAIVALANSEDTDASRKALTRYVMEAMRITTSAAGVSRKVANDIVIQDGDRQVSLKAGDMLFADLVTPPSSFSDFRILQTSKRTSSLIR
jgi:cytochrome P450